MIDKIKSLFGVIWFGIKVAFNWICLKLIATIDRWMSIRSSFEDFDYFVDNNGRYYKVSKHTKLNRIDILVLKRAIKNLNKLHKYSMTLFEHDVPNIELNNLSVMLDAYELVINNR